MKIIFSFLIFLLGIFSFAQSIPFIGKRDFNIEQGASGSGTPAYYLDVKKNGDVHFGYLQINQADRKETKEEINAGIYDSKVMKVHFKTSDEIFYVKFDEDKIYLTDEEGNIRTSDDCCPLLELPVSDCECKSILYKS